VGVRNIVKILDSKLLINNKKERYSRVPRLSDTRYSANGTKGKWRNASTSIYGYVGGRQI